MVVMVESMAQHGARSGTSYGRGGSRNTVQKLRHTSQLETSSGLRAQFQDGVLTVVSAGFEQSVVHADDPTRLDFEYLQQMDVVLAQAVADQVFGEELLQRPQQRGQSALRIFHAGAGACALPWAWSVSYPGARQACAEVDRELVEFVRQSLPLPGKLALSLQVGDAREVLASYRKAQFQVVVRDAFCDEVVPPHLTTQEWNQLVWTQLAPGGMYMANVAHSPSAPARREIAAIEAVFDCTFLVGEPKALKTARKGNLVAVGLKARALQSSALGTRAAKICTSIADTLEAGASKTVTLPTSSTEVGILGAAGAGFDFDALDRKLRSMALPVRIVRPTELKRWLGGAKPLSA